MAASTTSPRYPIPAEERRVEIRASNSRFIATAGYAPTVDDARAMIARVRSAFSDATHNVFAYIVGHGATQIEGMSDDGEPGGTAGRPVLAVLRGSGLGDVCVIVTRYFGGTLLGTGGLVRAYGDAVKAVLAELPRQEKVALRGMVMVAPYGLYESMRTLVEAQGAVVEAQEFGVDVTLQLRVATDLADQLVAAVTEQSAGRVAVYRDGPGEGQ